MSENVYPCHTNAEIIELKSQRVADLDCRVAKLEEVLMRIAQHPYELEGTAASWKDIALSMTRLANSALNQ